MAALRSTTALKPLQSFTATAPRLPGVTVSARKLHMTGSSAQSPFLASESAVTELQKESQRSPVTRHFNTSRVLKTTKDSSTMDFAYMPSLSFATDTDNEIRNIPLLPDNYYPERPANQVDIETEPVVMPQISVTSLRSDVVAMGESEGGKSADGLGLAKDMEKEIGVFKEVFRDIVDDLFGAKKVAV